MSNLTEIKVPDIGDFDEVEIIEVHVSTGDAVSVEDPLITLESDKATMDVPASASGVVKEVKVQVGDMIGEGGLVLLLEITEETPSPGMTTEEPTEDSSKDEAPAKTPETSATVEPRPAKKPSPQHQPPESLPDPMNRSGVAPAHASPAVRRFARELGADLNQIRGSGPKNRIMKEDVKAFVKTTLTRQADSVHSQTASGIPPIPEVDFSKWGETDTQPLQRIKRISGAHLHRAWLNIPHVTHHDEADVTDLEKFRKSLKAEAEKQGVRVTTLAFIMKAVVAALREFPRVNSSLHADGENLVYKKYFNIGIAVDTPIGLVVPVFKGVDKKSIFELAEEMGEVSARAREGKLKPDEMQGGCFSISSLGGIGGTAFTPVVNAPEVAILGVSRARMTPVWSNAEFSPRLMLPLDLSYDHRVIDGAEAARFCVFLCQLLSDVRRILL